MRHTEYDPKVPGLSRREFFYASLVRELIIVGTEILAKLPDNEKYECCLETLTYHPQPYRSIWFLQAAGELNVVYAGLRLKSDYTRRLDFYAVNKATFLRVFLNRAGDRKKWD